MRRLSGTQRALLALLSQRKRLAEETYQAANERALGGLSATEKAVREGVHCGGVWYQLAGDTYRTRDIHRPTFIALAKLAYVEHVHMGVWRITDAGESRSANLGDVCVGHTVTLGGTGVGAG